MARLIWWLAWIAAIAVVLFFLKVPGHAHMPDRPDLDKWFMHLQSKGGMGCCDFTDAEKIADPQIDMRDGYYWVFLDETWWKVEDNALVDGPNKYGEALVWPIRYNGKIVRIRCFLPGAGI